MTAHDLIILFLGHWVGDYLFQTSKMAQQKRNGIKWLSIHVGVYSMILFIFTLFLLDYKGAALFTSTNALLHWITDFFTSRLSAKFIEKPRVFYPVLGFDQLIHTTCLIGTFEALHLYTSVNAI
jgi:hypothetical protein